MLTAGPEPAIERLKVAAIMIINSTPYICSSSKAISKENHTFFRPNKSASKPNPNWPMTAPTEEEILIAVSDELDSLPSAGFCTCANITMAKATAKS